MPSVWNRWYNSRDLPPDGLFYRGILATEYALLKKKADGSLPSHEEIKAVYDKYYGNEKFVRVLDKGKLLLDFRRVTMGSHSIGLHILIHFTIEIINLCSPA